MPRWAVENGLKTQFCDVLDADGLHEDGWCAPKLRLRLRAARPSLKVTLSIWMPAQGGERPVDFRVMLGRTRLFRRGHRFRVTPGQPTPMTVLADIDAGDEVFLTVSTRHHLNKDNADIRNLSFMLQGVALGGRV